MPFPSNPTNGQTATVNNVNYQYDGTAWNRLTSASTAAPVLFSDNLLPSANVSYDIGTTTNRFRSLYLSGNTVDIGGATIKTDATTGAIALIAQPTTANPNPTGIVVSPTGAISTVSTTAGVVSAGAVATASNAATPTTTIPLISNVVVTNSSWAVLDDTAVDTAGGYIRLTGSGFENTSSVLFNNTSATAVTYGNSTTLYVQTPALSSASYTIYVVNSSGATGIRVSGVTASTFTAWSTAATLANVANATPFSVNLAATSDSSITYANTTTLPPGTTLASNGYFYGTTTVNADTTYSFTVKATDAELQDASRTFSMTALAISPLPSNVIFYMSGQGSNGAVPTGKVADGTSVNMTQYLGSPAISTAQSKYGSSSVRVGSGQTLAYTLGSFAVGSGDFTIEGWYRCDNSLSERIFFGFGNYARDVSGGFTAVTDNSRKMFLNINNGYASTDGFSAGGSITAGAWTHLAVVKSGTTWTTFVNGSAYQSTVNSGTITSSVLFIGRGVNDNWGNGDFYINDLRVSNVARYSGSYTPPSYFNY